MYVLREIVGTLLSRSNTSDFRDFDKQVGTKTRLFEIPISSVN